MNNDFVLVVETELPELLCDLIFTVSNFTMSKKHTIAFWRELLRHLSTKDNEINLYK